jgi:hypothetical protein
VGCVVGASVGSKVGFGVGALDVGCWVVGASDGAVVLVGALVVGAVDGVGVVACPTTPVAAKTKHTATASVCCCAARTLHGTCGLHWPGDIMMCERHECHAVLIILGCTVSHFQWPPCHGTTQFVHGVRQPQPGRLTGWATAPATPLHSQRARLDTRNRLDSSVRVVLSASTRHASPLPPSQSAYLREKGSA